MEVIEIHLITNELLLFNEAEHYTPPVKLQP